MIKTDDKMVLWRLVNKIRRENGLPELLFGEFQEFIEIFRDTVLRFGK